MFYPKIILLSNRPVFSKKILASKTSNKALFGTICQYMFLFVFLLSLFSASSILRAENEDVLWSIYTHRMYNVEFSPDETKILTTGEGGTKIFYTENGLEYLTFEGLGSYTDDGTMLIMSASCKNSNDENVPCIDIYDANTYKKIRTILLDGNKGVGGLLLSPDNKTLVRVTDYGISFIDFTTEKVKKNIYYGTDFKGNKLGIAGCYKFSKDSKYLIYTVHNEPKGEGTKLLFLNLETYEIDYQTTEGKWSLIMSKDGSKIAFCSNTEGIAVRIMDTETKEIIASIPGQAAAVTGLCFSPDGKYIAVSLLNKYNIEVYDIPKMNLIKTLKYKIEGIPIGFRDLAITDDNKLLEASSGPVLILFSMLKSSIDMIVDSNDILKPNPAEKTIEIIYKLPVSTELTYTIYDTQGIKQKILKTAYYTEGTIKETFDISSFASGTYLLQIESEKFTKTFKLIIKH